MSTRFLLAWPSSSSLRWPLESWLCSLLQTSPWLSNCSSLFLFTMVDGIKASILNDLTEFEEEGGNNRSRADSVPFLNQDESAPSRNHSHLVKAVRARSCSWGGPTLELQFSEGKYAEGPQPPDEPGSKLDRWFKHVKKKALGGRKSKETQRYRRDVGKHTLRLSPPQKGGEKRRSSHISQQQGDLSPRSILRKLTPREKPPKSEDIDGTKHMKNPLYGKASEVQRAKVQPFLRSNSKDKDQRPHHRNSSPSISRSDDSLPKIDSNLIKTRSNNQLPEIHSPKAIKRSSEESISTRKEVFKSFSHESSNRISTPPIYLREAYNSAKNAKKSGIMNSSQRSHHRKSFSPCSSFSSEQNHSPPTSPSAYPPAKSLPVIAGKAAPVKKGTKRMMLRDLAGTQSNFILSMPQLAIPVKPRPLQSNITATLLSPRIPSIKLKRSRSEPNLNSWDYLNITEGYDILIPNEYIGNAMDAHFPADLSQFPQLVMVNHSLDFFRMPWIEAVLFLSLPA